MRKCYSVPALAVICTLLVSCSEEAEAPPANTSGGVCREVMELNAVQNGADEQQKAKYLEGCMSFEAMGHSVAEWQCVLGDMKQGGSYIKGTEKCFPK